VYALAVSGSDLYAGGVFTNAGGSAANYIAKWDGNRWSALGTGMNGPVLALAVSGSDVYAGGVFTAAGGNAANYIAKWDGSTWSALASGVSQTVLGMHAFVSALAVSGDDLYVGGVFTTAGAKVSAYIARAFVGEPDEDKDGVPDSRDQCPGTAPGAIVNADGCSIDQLVPCEGTWK